MSFRKRVEEVYDKAFTLLPGDLFTLMHRKMWTDSKGNVIRVEENEICSVEIEEEMEVDCAAIYEAVDEFGMEKALVGVFGKKAEENV